MRLATTLGIAIGWVALLLTLLGLTFIKEQALSGGPLYVAWVAFCLLTLGIAWALLSHFRKGGEVSERSGDDPKIRTGDITSYGQTGGFTGVVHITTVPDPVVDHKVRSTNEPADEGLFSTKVDLTLSAQVPPPILYAEAHAPHVHAVNLSLEKTGHISGKQCVPEEWGGWAKIDQPPNGPYLFEIFTTKPVEDFEVRFATS